MQDLVFGSGGGSSSDGAALLDPPRLRRGPQPAAAASAQPRVKCPRCDSLDTKFCYYNNYNLSQPRHFCKSCRRYWTRGGALRNVPVGGASRKPKRSGPTSKPPRTKSRKLSEVVDDDDDHRSEGSTLTAPATSEGIIIFPDSSSTGGNFAGGFDCGGPLGVDLPPFCLGPQDRQLPSVHHPTALDLPPLWPGTGLFDGAHVDQVGSALWAEGKWVDDGDPCLFLP